MPMNSAAPRRSSWRDRGAVSRPSPLSTMKRSGWTVVSAVISVEIGRAQRTGTPSFTSAAARARCAGVMRFRVPNWSSAPQRPQLLRRSSMARTSPSVGTTIGLLAAGLGAPGRLTHLRHLGGGLGQRLALAQRALGQAFFQGLHEVDDLLALGGRRGGGDFLALDLLVDDVEDAIAVLVLVLLRLELVGGEALDQLHGQLELPRLDLGRLSLVDLVEVSDLVGEVHRVQHEAALGGAN